MEIKKPRKFGEGSLVLLDDERHIDEAWSCARVEAMNQWPMFRKEFKSHLPTVL